MINYDSLVTDGMSPKDALEEMAERGVILNKDEVICKRVVNCRFLGRAPICIFNGFKCSFEECKAATFEEVKS